MNKPKIKNQKRLSGIQSYPCKLCKNTNRFDFTNDNKESSIEQIKNLNESQKKDKLEKQY